MDWQIQPGGRSYARLFGIVLALAPTFQPTAVEAQVRRFDIDRDHSVVGFEVPLAGGLTRVRGGFTEFDGTILYNPTDPSASTVHVVIETSSVNTGNERRDSHLRHADFFDAETWPRIEFVSTGVETTAEGGVLVGILTMKGKSHQIRLPFRRLHDDPIADVLGIPTLGFEALLRVNRKDLGLEANTRWNRPLEAAGETMMSDSVDIVLNVIAEDRGPRVTLRYLGHSGWRLTTDDHVVLFDWVEGDPELTPSLLAGRTLTVFTTHEHADHYADSLIARLAERPNTSFIFGWDGPDVPNATVLGPREAAEVGGLTVRTIASTDLGVGFLVGLPGLTVLHAGDHANWGPGSTDDYRAEIDWLAGLGESIDVALLPVATGAACETNESLREGALYAMKELSPRIAIPMHVRCPDRYESIYGGIRDAAAAAQLDTRVVVVEQPGQVINLQDLLGDQSE